jgi:hypothetical protein
VALDLQGAEHPLDLRALAEGMSGPLVERVGAIEHCIELFDVERRGSTSLRREHLSRSLAHLGA